MKPQSAQRNTLCSPKEFPLKEKLELKAVEAMNKLYEAQLLTYLRAMNKRVGLLINFNVERLKNGIKRLIVSEDTEGEEI